jgi:hypothetical protein
MGKHPRTGEETQSLEAFLLDCPDMDEGYIDRRCAFLGLSLDAADRCDLLARRDELIDDEANVKSAVEYLRRPARKRTEHC